MYMCIPGPGLPKIGQRYPTDKTLSRGYVLIIEIYPEASIIHLVNNQDMNDSYTPVVSMPFFHKQLPMMS